MKYMDLLIKPASGRCNMHCAYCFYRDETENRTVDDYGMMTEETTRALIDRAYAEADSVRFMFQGGEPTLRGLPFFQSFVSYALENGLASFALQTNGTLINDEWIAFLRDNDFLVGLSIDGDGKTHDAYRKGANGKGTFKRVFETSRKLINAGVKLNSLVTVTEKGARDARSVYSFLKRNGMRYQQYIPCIDPIGEEGLPYSLTPEAYGRFLISLFHLYYSDWKKGDYVSIRYFDNLVLMLTGEEAEECGMNGICSSSFTIEADGSVYPCDFYVLDEYRLGNVVTDTFASLAEKRNESGFVSASMKKDPECLACRFHPLCNGGCRRNRENFSTGVIERNRFCISYRKFFSECLPLLLEMAESEKAMRRKV